MSSIGGKKRESSGNNENYTKRVGLFEAKVIAINPSLEEYKDKLGIELKEDSKAVEYLGESRDGNTYLRLDFWLEEVKNKDRFKVSFFLENKEKENKDEVNEKLHPNQQKIDVHEPEKDELTAADFAKLRAMRKKGK